jgi:quercetin dioxygenase-like cupin family protein
MAEQPSTNPFAQPLRIISTHDAATGRAVFSDVDEKPPVGSMPNPTGGEHTGNMRMYTTNSFPVSGLSPPSEVTSEVNANLDLRAYMQDLDHPSAPDGSHPGQTCCRMVDMAPGAEGPIHRTITLDYAVVIDGVVEWELDSDQTRILKKGDVSIQRGTAHAWKNITPPEQNNGWARMFFVTLSSEKVRVKDGRELGYGFGLPRLGDPSKSPR